VESDVSWQHRPPSFSFSSHRDSEHSADSHCGRGERVREREEVGRRAGTILTCFTRTHLTCFTRTHLTCFTRTKVQIVMEVGGSGMGCG
jgi:hypothetical protein